MILNGCTLSSGVFHLNSQNRKPCSSRLSKALQPPQKVPYFCRTGSWGQVSRLNLDMPFAGIQPGHLSTASTLLLCGDHGTLKHAIPTLPKRRPSSTPIRASKDVSNSHSYPAMTKKPKWWWRTLACMPYLIPLHEAWQYAETAYHLHPFLQDFKFLTMPFIRSIQQLPRWFPIAYCLITFLGVVRRKEWPHFFRFHTVSGILLEMALQVIGTVSCWMPLSVYWGKVGMHFWTGVTFAYLFTVLECLRCALAGMYADVPFLSDAAYIGIHDDW